MKKFVKVFIIIVLCVILGGVGFFVGDKVMKNRGNNSNNVVAESGKNSSDAEVKNVSGNVEKIDITNEDKLRILGYASDFKSVDELTTGDMIHLAFIGIHRDWVPRMEIAEDSYVENMGVPYPESYIKNIIYSVFGVEIKDHTLNDGEYIQYKDGYYYYQWGDGDPIPEPINIESNNNGENTYYTYDVIYEGNAGVYYKGEKNEVCMDKDGAVKSKKSISDKLFEKNESMKYDKSDIKNPVNALAAILNAGEKEFITEKKDGYYVFKDELGKTYEIKCITDIAVEDQLKSEDGNYVLFECDLYYTDKNGKDVDNDGYLNHIDIAIVLDKELKKCEIHSPTDNYVKSQKESKNYKYEQ